LHLPKGLLVYQHDGTEGFYYFDGTAWTRLANGIYTETDPVFGASAAHGISSTNITNWNTAFGWGNHMGLYRPISYVPAWGEITSNPFSFSSVANNQLLKYNSTTSKWENWTPDFLTSFTETDPVVKGINGIIKSNGTTISAAVAGTDYLSPTGSAALLTNFPTLNQNTTGNAATATTANNITGGTGGSIPYQIAVNTTTFLAKGTTGQVLTMNSGATAPQWATPTTGTVTAVTGTAPIVSSGGNTPAISISSATTSTAGSMSAADKTKLNSQTTGTATGQMQYWNGTAWATVASGLNGQILKYKNGVPTWSDGNIDDLAIGDAYEGGIIAYFLQTGDPGYDANVRHGLIAAPNDQGTAPFGCIGTTVGTSQSFGTGAANTAKIIDSCSTAGISARFCSNLVLNAYEDWFMPSWYELEKLYPNKDAIGGFGTGFYATSSEFTIDTYVLINFTDGGGFSHNKIYGNMVRCIRTF